MSRRTLRLTGLLAVPAVLLAGAGWYALKTTSYRERYDNGPFVATMSPGKAVPVAEYRLSGPHAHGNLTVFLVLAPETLAGHSFVTLQEGLERRNVVVHETGQVSRLSVENRSDEELFIQSGDIVKGGKQDRTLPYDTLVAAGSGQVPVDSFCVEQSRWKERGKESGEYFSSSSYNLGTSDMKRAASAPGVSSQGEVWRNVAKTQERLGKKLGTSVQAEASASSLQLTLESPALRAAVAPYLRAIESLPGGEGEAVGVVVAVNGVAKSADVYASRNLFLKLWPKLLEGAAVEAFIESEPGRVGSPVAESAVREFLAATEGATPAAEAVTERSYVQVRQSPKAVVTESCDRARENLVLHRSILLK